MRIKMVTDDYIEFDTGDMIWSCHEPTCCEDNYAAFKEVDDLAFEADFDQPLIFESVSGGFRFGNKGKMFFVPCYSDQNGFYTDEVDIELNGSRVLRCEGTII